MERTKVSALARLISSEVRAECARRGVTQNELAVALGRSQNYVSLRWRDEAAFTLDDIDAVSTLFDVEPEQFVAVATRGRGVVSDGATSVPRRPPAQAPSVDTERSEP